MIVGNYKGYLEGMDILQIPADFLTYPSKNCLVYKGKVLSRSGTKNDGVASTENTRIHSEYVWKKAPGGAKPLRVWGTALQVKWDGMWITIFTGFNASTTRVRFTSWIDTNGSIIKNRLFMVDGTDSIYEWNGAIGRITANGIGVGDDVVTISDSKSLLQLGFDVGNVSSKNVKVVKVTRNSSDVITSVDSTVEYAHADDLSGNDNLTLSSTPSPLPVEDDLIIGSVIDNTDKLVGIDKDDIYAYKNHLFVSALDSGRIYYSHSIDYLVFTIPGSKTSVTADLLDLDGYVTAMISRKDTLWISTTDDWFKIVKTVSANEYGFWTNIEKFEQAESVGALKYAVAIHKGDIVFMSQDKNLRRVVSIDALGVDEIQLTSEGIDGLLNRLALTDVRIYYKQRYIYIISASEGVTLMLDTISGEFMPPQYIGMTCMSTIDGVDYGHSNARNETFYLFNGRNDLGGQIEMTVAPGYIQGRDQFRYEKHNLFGMHCRGTETTHVDLDYEYEEFGAKILKPASFDVKDIKVYDVPVDVSFGANPFAVRSFAGIDDTSDTSLKGFLLFDKQEMVSWFNFRPVLNISGKDMEFHLLAWKIDNEPSEMFIGGDLFINRE